MRKNLKSQQSPQVRVQSRKHSRHSNIERSCDGPRLPPVSQSRGVNPDNERDSIGTLSIVDGETVQMADNKLRSSFPGKARELGSANEHWTPQSSDQGEEHSIVASTRTHFDETAQTFMMRNSNDYSQLP